MSVELLTELKAVLERPKTQRFVRYGRGQRFVQLIGERAIFTPLAQDAPRCRDPKDDMVIATAVAGQSEFIITADHDLLDDATLQQNLQPYNLRVVWPLDFLKLLK